MFAFAIIIVNVSCANIGKVTPTDTPSYLKEIRRRRDTGRRGEGDMQIRAEELPRGRLKPSRNDLLHLVQRVRARG